MHSVQTDSPFGTGTGSSSTRNLSQGRANFTMHFEHYEAVPFNLAEEVVEKRRKKKDQ